MTWSFNREASTLSVEVVPVEPRERRDIVDEIDALVDEQMAGGEPRQGYDYGDPTYPKCPHCDRHWHGLPLTERIVSMYSTGYYDEEYSAADDDSPVLCQGSEFIGPMPSEYVDYVQSVRYNYGNWSRPNSEQVGAPNWIDEMIAFAERYCAELLTGLGFDATFQLWLPGDPTPSDPQGDPYGPAIEDGQVVTFIDQNGRSFTERASVVGGPGDSATVITIGAARSPALREQLREQRSPMLRAQQQLMRMAPLVGELTGQHYENRRLPMRLDDV